MFTAAYRGVSQVTLVAVAAERMFQEDSCPRHWQRWRSPWSNAGLVPLALEWQGKDSMLPAMRHWEAIRQASRSNEICYVRGAPGSGKSTQVPQIIAESAKCVDGWSSRRIWHVMPYVEAAKAFWTRLQTITQDERSNGCVALYNGKYANQVACTREIVAVHTAQTCLERLLKLIEDATSCAPEEGLRDDVAPEAKRLHLILDEAEETDVCVQFLIAAGKALHEMGLVKLWIMSASLHVEGAGGVEVIDLALPPLYLDASLEKHAAKCVLTARTARKGVAEHEARGQDKKYLFLGKISAWRKTNGLSAGTSAQGFEESGFWGQTIVREYDWAKLGDAFESGVRYPQTVRDFDIRFGADDEKAKKNAAWYAYQETGFFCDCDGQHCWPYFSGERLEDRKDESLPTDLRREDMPRLLRTCCQKLPFGPLPRKRDDGHWQVLHPTLQKKYYKEAWEDGIADFTWKCWACLAHGFGVDYDELSATAFENNCTEGFKKRRSNNRMDIERGREKRLYELLKRMHG